MWSLRSSPGLCVYLVNTHLFGIENLKEVFLPTTFTLQIRATVGQVTPLFLDLTDCSVVFHPDCLNCSQPSTLEPHMLWSLLASDPASLPPLTRSSNSTSYTSICPSKYSWTFGCPESFRSWGIAVNVTKFSLSCFLTGKDRERNCAMCLNAKESKEGAYMCVFWKQEEAGDFSAACKSRNWRQKGVWG